MMAKTSNISDEKDKKSMEKIISEVSSIIDQYKEKYYDMSNIVEKYKEKRTTTDEVTIDVD